MLHNNVRSLKRNLEDFQMHLSHQLNFNVSVIGITETKIGDSNFSNFNPEIPGYKFEFVPTPLASGGVGMYISNDLRYVVLERCSNNAFQALWVEIYIVNGKKLYGNGSIDSTTLRRAFKIILKILYINSQWAQINLYILWVTST